MLRARKWAAWRPKHLLNAEQRDAFAPIPADVSDLDLGRFLHPGFPISKMFARPALRSGGGQGARAAALRVTWLAVNGDCLRAIPAYRLGANDHDACLEFVLKLDPADRGGHANREQLRRCCSPLACKS